MHSTFPFLFWVPKKLEYWRFDDYELHLHLKVTVFWDVAMCSLVETMVALMMETVRTSETSVSFHQTTQRNIPEVIFIYFCRTAFFQHRTLLGFIIIIIIASAANDIYIGYIWQRHCLL
jgi:hypothetical protein